MVGPWQLRHSRVSITTKPRIQRPRLRTWQDLNARDGPKAYDPMVGWRFDGHFKVQRTAGASGGKKQHGLSILAAIAPPSCDYSHIHFYFFIYLPMYPVIPCSGYTNERGIQQDKTN
jgi:hypothetical protein